ncbi:MAG: TIGR03087 family PEP-CTERM/XrtA system glycosyltransferase [Candidatus Poribacteria bacterium]|nr:TIGR03087 family PEP-CTERM/XrtA system glycosyltransferase [Candidatus Poribacteria bacterium]
MRILFLSLRCPYPPHRGDRIRSYHFIKQLSKRHDITSVFFAESDSDIEAVEHLQPFCERVEWVRFRPTFASINTAIHCLSPNPLQVHYWYSSQMQRKINQLLDEIDYDLIHAQLFRMGQYVKKTRGITKVLDLCDSLALNLARRAELDCTPKRFLVKLEEKRVRRYEVEIMKSFDSGTVVANFDRDYLLNQDKNLNLSVVPMGVDLKYFNPMQDNINNGAETYNMTSSIQNESAKDRSKNLLFTGTMNYFPNSDAVIYFCNDIFPLIQKQHPEITFYIVGNHPTEQVRRLSQKKGVIVTGFVPDIRPYFQKASVFVAPLRAGSGIQTKNLEAMAMETPVVTTSIGAMGLEAEVDKELLIADTPKLFAESVNNLIENPDVKHDLAKAGRKRVETSYDWQVLVERLEQVYKLI